MIVGHLCADWIYYRDYPDKPNNAADGKKNKCTEQMNQFGCQTHPWIITSAQLPPFYSAI